MKIITEFRGREVSGDAAKQLRHEAAIGLEVTRILSRRGMDEGTADVPDREAVRHAMDTVEARVVEALWTLARLPQGRGPGGPSRHGIDYVQDQAERFANAVSAGGVWEQEPPRPPRPSSKAIDAMWEPLTWITTEFLPRDRAMLVMAAASTKRGERERSVSWARVVQFIPALGGCSVRTLQRRYQDGIRAIVAELLVRGETK